VVDSQSLDATATVSPAADAPAAEMPAPEVTGYVETGYHLNLSEPHNDVPVPLRSYDGQGGNQFMLHAAHLAVNHAFSDQVSAVVEIDAGSDAAVTEATGTAYAFDLQEAYAKYASGGGFSLIAGKFVTWEGIEVIEGPLNPTLTRGFLFGLAEPFTHVGVKAGYATDSGLDFNIGVVNGWDQWLDNNDWKTIIFRIGYTTDTFFINGNGTIGAEQTDNDDDQRVSIDVTGGVIIDSIALNFQGNFGLESVGGVDDNWFGLGVQPVYSSGPFSFGGRLEWFMNKEGSRVAPAVMATDVSLLNLTLTPGYTLAEHFTMRLEYRMDLVLDATSVTDKDVLNGESSQHTVGIAAHYVFN
jgi:hypothetical protein